MSEFWIRKCDSAACGKEIRIESQVPTIVQDAEWVSVRVGNSGPIVALCEKCGAAIRALVREMLPMPEFPESDADRGPIQ